ncbi:MAG: hypothetical protein RSD49_01110 [Hafnia sp.]
MKIWTIIYVAVTGATTINTAYPAECTALTAQEGGIYKREFENSIFSHQQSDNPNICTLSSYVNYMNVLPEALQQRVRLKLTTTDIPNGYGVAPSGEATFAVTRSGLTLLQSSGGWSYQVIHNGRGISMKASRTPGTTRTLCYVSSTIYKVYFEPFSGEDALPAYRPTTEYTNGTIQAMIQLNGTKYINDNFVFRCVTRAKQLTITASPGSIDFIETPVGGQTDTEIIRIEASSQPAITTGTIVATDGDGPGSGNGAGSTIVARLDGNDVTLGSEYTVSMPAVLSVGLISQGMTGPEEKHLKISIAVP